MNCLMLNKVGRNNQFFFLKNISFLPFSTFLNLLIITPFDLELFYLASIPFFTFFNFYNTTLFPSPFFLLYLSLLHIPFFYFFFYFSSFLFCHSYNPLIFYSSLFIFLFLSLKCCLCHLALGDGVASRGKLEEFKNVDYSFASSRECTFLEQLLSVSTLNVFHILSLVL